MLLRRALPSSSVLVPRLPPLAFFSLCIPRTVASTGPSSLAQQRRSRWFASAGKSSQTALPAEEYFATKSSCRAAGIVGLPNVGKSTLFNALARTQLAQVANYPFCTIQPNISKVEVPDIRLQQMAQKVAADKVTPMQIEFVDIAGLVRGASKGLGLGNQFLSNIRSVSVVVHMVRCYEDPEITHVENTVDPLRDIDILDAELILSDQALLESMLAKKSTGMAIRAVIEKTMKVLEAGQPARKVVLKEDEWSIFKQFGLLTAKPQLFACNVEERDAAEGSSLSSRVLKRCADAKPPLPAVVVSAKIENEIAQLSDDASKKEFLSMYNLEESRMAALIHNTRQIMKQITFYTVGKPEAKAYSIPKGITIREAAGHIHSDFEKGFIKADVTSAEDFLLDKSARIEGGDYVMRDGDVITVRFK